VRHQLWRSVSGVELERSYVGGERMTENVPGGSAVYAWKRKFQPPSGIVADPGALASWIAEAVKIPSAILPQRELSHCLLLHGLSIGGAALTDEKLQTLSLWVTEAKSRRWLLAMVESIGTLAPPLYIGEADNLARRVKDHLGNRTDFSLTLRDKLKLTWQDCELWYCSIPEEFLALEPKGRRTLIELVVARLTIAGSTSRPG
jgi:hypothetical protein